MRRFFSVVILFLFAIPFGVSISGCSKNIAPTFCNGGDSGLTAGTVTTITLLPKIYGYSLNNAEIGQVGNPQATDCKGQQASVASYIYTTTDMTLADIQPNTGRLCAGSWNRNTGGGIPDYTYCTSTGRTGTAYVTASADGVTSNPLPVFVHPVVTSVVFGSPSTNCTTDPTTSCCPLATADAVTAPPYDGSKCLSQGSTAQLVARVYAGTGATRTNISCQAGHLQYSAQSTANGFNTNVVSIDQNGVATAGQPGSALISANVSNAASSAGFFSTCPPASIALKASGATTDPVPLNLNNNLPLLATVLDTNGVTLTGLSLEYVSTAPTTIPAGANGTVTPGFAGAASISAICQPPSCNPASYSQIGLFGNGKPVTSNSVNITTPGVNGTVLYMASTQSLYLVPVDFTTTVIGTPVLLPFAPNSMVISNDGSTLYLGTSGGLVELSTVNQLQIIKTDTSAIGNVLAVSPDGTVLVMTDPARQTVSLQNVSGGIATAYGGVGTRAAYAPDGQTVYITTGTVTTPATATAPAVIAPGNQVLVYSNYTGWTSVTNSVASSDVAVTVPSVGAYFAGPSTTARGYCAVSTPSTANGVTSETNAFYPLADTSPVPTDRIAATNNGQHILGATASTAKPTLADLRVTIPVGSCPLPPGGTSATVTTPSPGLTFGDVPSTTLLSQVTATAITGVIPASDSSIAFVTYNGTGGVLPAYAPAASGLGLTTYVKLSGGAIAPLVGVISADNSTFYTGTSGDNLVHLINRGTLTDSSTIAPNLRDANGNIVPVNLMTQKPRRTT